MKTTKKNVSIEKTLLTKAISLVSNKELEHVMGGLPIYIPEMSEWSTLEMVPPVWLEWFQEQWEHQTIATDHLRYILQQLINTGVRP